MALTKVTLKSNKKCPQGILVKNMSHFNLYELKEDGFYDWKNGHIIINTGSMIINLVLLEYMSTTSEMSATIKFLNFKVELIKKLEMNILE